MGTNGEENIKVTRWSAALASFAFIGKPDARTVFYTLRNIDREVAFLGDTALAMAGVAGVGDNLAAALACGAGAFHRKETRLRTHRTRTLAGTAGFGRCAGLGTGTFAGVTGNRSWHADLRGLAGESFGE